MKDREEFGLAKKIRNVATAAVLVPASSFGPINFETGHNLLDISQNSNSITLNRLSSELTSPEKGFFEQFDEYLETDYGKVLAFSFLAASLAFALHVRKVSPEIDTSRKQLEAGVAVLSAVSLASIMATESLVDVNPKIAAALLEAFIVSNGVYNMESVFERHREWLTKRATTIAIHASLLAGSTALLVESIK